MKSQAHLLKTPLDSSPFELFNLMIESSVLKNNHFGDSPQKHNYVLVPQTKKALPVVFHLSGYFGNGYQSFNLKVLEKNFPQEIITATKNKKIPLAIHVFVDAMTSLGGSQFINSQILGNYCDYLQSEVILAVEKHFPVIKKSESRCLIGTSSGGYGALHHVSLQQSPFDVALVSAPDSDFEKSLLPDFYKTAPYLSDLNTLKKIKSALSEGVLQKKKNYFDIFNTLAMTACYSTLKKDHLEFPIDLKNGDINQTVWKKWLTKDPIYFLKERKKELKNKKVILEVGTFDEFSLYFGARKIRDILSDAKIDFDYEEFPGGHFNSTERKIHLLEKLQSIWG